MSNILSTSIAVASGSSSPAVSNQIGHANSATALANQIAQAVANGDPAVVVNLSNAGNNLKAPITYGKSRRTDEGRGASGEDRGGKEKVNKDEDPPPPKPVGGA